LICFDEKLIRFVVFLLFSDIIILKSLYLSINYSDEGAILCLIRHCIPFSSAYRTEWESENLLLITVQV
jgi:hypothetical protein